MNSKHTGFELYRTFLPGEAIPELSRKLDPEIESQGPIEGSRGYIARAKLAVKTMTPLRFPRYLDRDPRDFFFLTQKPVLPGPALQIGAASLTFATAGLPHAGWPNAFAPTGVVEPTGELALYIRHIGGLRRFAIGEPPANATVLLRGHPLEAGNDGSMRGSVLAIDSEGFLVYAEADRGREAWLIQQLASAGFPQALVLPSDARLSLVTETGQAAVSGDSVAGASGVLGPLDTTLTLVAETRAPAEVMSPELKPKPYRFWGWLQGQRVRYFPSGEPRFKAPEDALPPGATGLPPGSEPANAPNADGAGGSVPKPAP